MYQTTFAKTGMQLYEKNWKYYKIENKKHNIIQGD